MITLPRTRAGRRAGYLIILMIIYFLAVNLIIGSAGITSEETGINWSIIPGFAIGILSALASVFAVTKEKERSLVVFLIPLLMIILLMFGSVGT